MGEGKLFRKKDSLKEEEKSKLDRIKTDISTNIFGVFYILLKSNESSLWKFIIINGV